MGFGNTDFYFCPTPSYTFAAYGAGSTTYVAASANRAWAAIFQATDTRDIKGVGINLQGVSSPGTYDIGIETVNSSHVPTGTLYDANARTGSITPSAAGWQSVATFSTLPTTGLVAGDWYAMVVRKLTGGTTCTFRARTSQGYRAGPNYLDTNDYTAPSWGNRQVSPHCYFQLEDDTFETFGCIPVVDGTTQYAFGADQLVGAKFDLPTACRARAFTLSIQRIGTPAGNLTLELFDSSNNVLRSVTIPKEAIPNSVSRYFNFDPIELDAGTYRIGYSSSGSANSSNTFGIRYGILPQSGLIGPNFCRTTCTNRTGAFTWTDDTASVVDAGLHIENVTVGGSSKRITSRIG